MCTLVGLVIWSSIITVIPIFFGYHKLEDNEYKKQQSGEISEENANITEQEEGSMELNYVRNEENDESNSN